MFRPGSTDDFPDMVEGRVDCPGLLMEEGSISFSLPLKWLVALPSNRLTSIRPRRVLRRAFIGLEVLLTPGSKEFHMH